MYKIQVYKNEEIEWNSFNEHSKNGTFLFNRKYMEYHRDRFDDFSLLLYDDKDSLVALLPANRKGNILFSHEGLTYGGIISNLKITTCQFVHLFSTLKEFLKTHQISSLVYKTIPQIYSDVLSQEDHYALFLNDAQVIRRDVFSVVDFLSTTPAPIQERRLRSRKKAEKENLIVELTTDLSQFWDLLTTTLSARHNVSPTHSLKEITLLASLFPNNIKLFICRNNQKILAGVLLYINKNTVHAQYISSSEDGFKVGALDFLFFYLIEEFKKSSRYFSFGISTENNGMYLNEGLINQKEGFGARSVLHDTYEVNII